MAGDTKKPERPSLQELNARTKKNHHLIAEQEAQRRADALAGRPDAQLMAQAEALMASARACKEDADIEKAKAHRISKATEKILKAAEEEAAKTLKAAREAGQRSQRE